MKLKQLWVILRKSLSDTIFTRVQLLILFPNSLHFWFQHEGQVSCSISCRMAGAVQNMGFCLHVLMARNSHLSVWLISSLVGLITWFLAKTGRLFVKIQVLSVEFHSHKSRLSETALLRLSRTRLFRHEFLVLVFLIIIFTSSLSSHAKQGASMLFRGVSFSIVCLLGIAP